MSAKQAVKNSAKKSKQASPLAIPVPIAAVLAAETHRLVLADYKAVVSEGKAGETVYGALKALMLSVDFTNSAIVSLTLADMFKVFADRFADKLKIRQSILRTAQKIVAGGKKNDKHVPGKGQGALVAILDKCTSIRDLRPALAEAKPEGLKDGNTKPAKGKKATPKAEAAPGAPLVVKAPDAFQAAVSILRQCENFLSAGTDAQLIGKIEALVRDLETAEIAARMPATEKAKPIPSVASRRKEKLAA